MTEFDELDVLRIVGDRLATLRLPYMLTGSFALAHYATPRMTRDIDIVVELDEAAVMGLVAAFEADFYVDPVVALSAVRQVRLFNLLHLPSGIKVDVIIRKPDDYRRLEFSRRQQVLIGDFPIWVVSREDLILSKLVWSRDSGSELQRQDIRALLDSRELDRDYLRGWAAVLGVERTLRELADE